VTDGDHVLYDGECLKVRFLPGCKAAQDEWKSVDHEKLLASLDAAEGQLVGPAKRVRGERLVKIEDVPGGAIYELKGPPRGKNINRALCFNPRGWELFVVFAAVKKSTELPSRWVKTARDRIRRAQDEGHFDG
jgi:hypothetical protein